MIDLNSWRHTGSNPGIVCREHPHVRSFSKVREFASKYLMDKHDTMLYVLSGPDFLYATSFVPNASTYVSIIEAAQAAAST